MPSVITGAHRRLRWGDDPPLRRASRATAEPTEALRLLRYQEPPAGHWRRWLLLAGRGAGKTLAGASYLLDAAAAGARLGVVAPTFADVRDVCFEGPSGLIAVARARGLAVEAYNRGMGEARIGGAVVKGYSADEPDRLRGPQHHRLWFDEVAAMRYGEATYDMAMLGLRLGDDPRAVLTTTPRPIPLVRALLADADTAVTRATTYDNPHLPEAFRQAITARYADTRLGAQELMAEILDDTPGALWTLAVIDAARVAAAPASLARVVVGVDPKSGGDGGDGETGIVIAARGLDGRGYVLGDATTGAGPAGWAAAVVGAVAAFAADAVVAEANQGGAMVEHVLRTSPGGARLPLRLVHASRGKVARAEPVAGLYAQGRVSHVGALPALETQMTTYVPGDRSPDRLDALVWALSELFPPDAPAPFVPPGGVTRASPWSRL